MRLATSSNIVCERPDGSVFSLEKTLQLASAAGFRVFDISFYDWSLPHSPFLGDGWEAWINGVAEEAARLGVVFGQCHAYTYPFLSSAVTEEQRARHEELLERSLYCCRVLGSKLCVTHPDTDRTAVDWLSASRRKNSEYMKRLLDRALHYDMELAVENMCDYSIAPLRKFFSQPEEIVDFLRDFNDDRLGLCWDFEHADIMQLPQRDALLYMRRYLKATHVSDTHSTVDDTLMHVMPLFGTVDWRSVMRTLHEIGYQGDFCLEAHNYANRLPDPLIPTALQLSHEIGTYLLSLAEEEAGL